MSGGKMCKIKHCVPWSVAFLMTVLIVGAWYYYHRQLISSCDNYALLTSTSNISSKIFPDVNQRELAQEYYEYQLRQNCYRGFKPEDGGYKKYELNP